MEEFLFTEIAVLEHATLLDNELLRRHFPTFTDHLGRMAKILKGKYQKEGIKYEGGMIPLGYPLQSSYAYNFLHAIFSTCTYE